MKLHKKKIELKEPLFLGWSILEGSKAVMYDIFYNKLKKVYPSLSMLYMDTDSFICSKEGTTFEGFKHDIMKNNFNL